MPDRISPDGEVYYPTAEVIAQARVKDWDALAKTALADPQAFWAREAEELEWYRRWDKVLDDSKKPFFKWFAGAQCTRSRAGGTSGRPSGWAGATRCAPPRTSR